MMLSQDVKPISYLKTKTADVIKTVTDTKRTIIITQWRSKSSSSRYKNL